ILYTLAVSSLSTYGILLAGYSTPAEDLLCNDLSSFPAPALSHSLSSDGTFSVSVSPDHGFVGARGADVHGHDMSMSMSSSSCAASASSSSSSSSSYSSQQPSPALGLLSSSSHYDGGGGDNVFHDPFALAAAPTTSAIGIGISNGSGIDATLADCWNFDFDMSNALEAAFITQAPPPVHCMPPPVAGLDVTVAALATTMGMEASSATSATPASLSLATTPAPASTAAAAAAAAAAADRKPAAKRSSTAAATTPPSKRSKPTASVSASASASAFASGSASPASSALAHSPSPAPEAATATATTATSSAADKRRRNTLAARRCRQRQLDKMAALERALEEALKETTELKVMVAKQQGEIEVLRSLIPGAGPGAGHAAAE
ncbi:hypothetical protein KEM52_002534, partial [Ascosphaera acerosa]